MFLYRAISLRVLSDLWHASELDECGDPPLFAIL